MKKRSDQRFSFEESKDERMEASHDESNSNAGRLQVYNSVPCYSEQEVKALAERLDNKETFREAQQVLITWLNIGQCNEGNSEHFCSLIQSCWNRMEKLKFKQREYFEEAQEAQEGLRKKNCCIQLQLNEIERVFKTIENKNIWSIFTGDQINKIQKMRTDILDLKNDILKGSVSIEVQEEKSSGMKIMNNEDVQTEIIAPKVQTKSGSLTCGLNTVNQKFEDPETRCVECQDEILKLNLELENSSTLGGKSNSILVDDNQQKKYPGVVSSCHLDEVHQNEMHIVSLISAILVKYPEGANIDCIYSHLKNSPIIKITCSGDIEKVIRKYPTLFIKSSPICYTLEKKWVNLAESLKE